jgi:hypothetical protein
MELVPEKISGRSTRIVMPSSGIKMLIKTAGEIIGNEITEAHPVVPG